jgi:HrpA-like RNA helicase
VNLAQVVLQLKTMGVADPRKFDYVTPPDVQSLLKAFEQLFGLGALDRSMELTEWGVSMSKVRKRETRAKQRRTNNRASKENGRARQRAGGSSERVRQQFPRAPTVPSRANSFLARQRAGERSARQQCARFARRTNN